MSCYSRLFRLHFVPTVYHGFGQPALYSSRDLSNLSKIHYRNCQLAKKPGNRFKSVPDFWRGKNCPEPKSCGISLRVTVETLPSDRALTSEWIHFQSRPKQSPSLSKQWTQLASITGQSPHDSSYSSLYWPWAWECVLWLSLELSQREGACLSVRAGMDEIAPEVLTFLWVSGRVSQ